MPSLLLRGGPKINLHSALSHPVYSPYFRFGLPWPRLGLWLALAGSPNGQRCFFVLVARTGRGPFHFRENRSLPERETHQNGTHAKGNQVCTTSMIMIVKLLMISFGSFIFGSFRLINDSSVDEKSFMFENGVLHTLCDLIADCGSVESQNRSEVRTYFF